MKNSIKYLSVLLIGLLGLASCETNDLVDEIARTGHFAPNVYMEVASGTISAGDSMEYTVEYWSEDSEFEILELWYSLDVNLKYELNSPYNTEYSLVLDSNELVREYHEVMSFEHSESYYDEDKKAYAFEDKFPVSYTLVSSEISSPDSYNESQMNRLFPESFIEDFYEGLFETLEYDDLKLILVTDFEILDEETLDSFFNEIDVTPEPSEEDQDPEPVFIYEMKEDAAPALLEHFKEITLEDLVYDEAVPAYGIEYFRGYEVKTKFRVVNGEGIENYSEEKTISVQ